MKNSKIPIIDLHSDYVLACYEKGIPYKSAKQTNMKMLKANNVKIIFAGFSYDDLLKDTKKQLELLLRETKKNKCTVLIKNSKDIETVFREQNSLGFILHLEGSEILDGSLKNLENLYIKGLRSLSLTHSEKNSLGSGNKDNPNTPLTSFGIQVVKETQRKKIILDLAHLNQKCFFQTAHMIKGPLLVSHSCAYSLCPDPRNVTDEQIKLVSQRNGVIGVFFSSKYVKQTNDEVTINDVVDHFVHIVKVGGINCVAVGSDFGGITTGLPKNLESVNSLQNLKQKLKKKGFKTKDIEKIFYKNAQRVISQLLT